MVQTSCGVTGTGDHRKNKKFSSVTHYYAVLSRQLPTSFMNLINLNVVSPEPLRIPQFNFPTTCSVCPKTERTLHSLVRGHPLFFLRLAWSDRPKFLAFSKQKIVTTQLNHFSLETILLISKMHRTAQRKTETKT